MASENEPTVPEESQGESELSLDDIFRDDGTFRPAGPVSGPLDTAKEPEPEPDEAEPDPDAEAIEAALSGEAFLALHEEVLPAPAATDEELAQLEELEALAGRVRPGVEVDLDDELALEDVAALEEELEDAERASAAEGGDAALPPEAPEEDEHEEAEVIRLGETLATKSRRPELPKMPPPPPRPEKGPAAEARQDPAKKGGETKERSRAGEKAGPGPRAEAPARRAGGEGGRKGRLTSGQMLHLMRLEAERAIEHKYPISGMVIGLDGFDDPAELDYRKDVMPKIFHEIKGVTYRNEVRGLGVWTERYQVAVFPHVTPEKIAELAEELVAKAGELENPSLLQQDPISISVGISHNLHAGECSFEKLIQDAETGMGLAQTSGGNRVIQARAVESEIDKLKEELDEQIREIHEQQDQLFGRVSGEENWGKNLIEKVIDLFKREPDQSSGVLRLEKEVIALIRLELAQWQNSSSVKKMLDSAQTIMRLEKRVQKLTESLGVTESELKKVAAMKSIDLGVSSIYRTVQGLSSDDEFAGVKKEMLKEIFDANIALKQAIKNK